MTVQLYHLSNRRVTLGTRVLLPSILLTLPSLFRSRLALPLLILPVLTLGILAVVPTSTTSAQNPVRGVIRPVPGSRPLAIQTPVVGQASTNAPNPAMMNGNSNGQRGRGRHRHGGNYYGPVFNYPYYNAPYYNYPYGGYGGYPYYGYGYSVSGVGLTIGYTNGNTGISVGFPYQASYLGGFVPAGYGAYPYGYVPYRNLPYGYRRNINRFNGGFFSPMSSVDGGFMDSLPLGDPGVEASSGSAVPAISETSETAPATTVPSQFLESQPRSSSVTARQRAMQAVLNADRAASQGDMERAAIESRKATRYAPDLAEGHLRYAMSLVAIGNYEKAAQELKTAVDYKPELANGQFQLSDWYGDREEAKTQELNGLANASLDSPDNGKLRFAVGVLLRMDGQVDRGDAILEQVGQQDNTLAPSVEQILTLKPQADRDASSEEPALRLVR